MEILIFRLARCVLLTLLIICLFFFFSRLVLLQVELEPAEELRNVGGTLFRLLLLLSFLASLATARS